ncbi:MAG: pentapeptide repeat-containing protein [Gordonia polyisoprenivorans]|nr:pentapeptide repeat-containing protein [Gordonia polyisoprenivorans]
MSSAANPARSPSVHYELGYITHAVVGGINFSGTDLSGANLSNADLSDAILNGAELTHAELWSNPVPARRVDTPWGLKWAVYDNHELRGKASRWVQVAGGDHRTRIAKLEGQGYRLGRVRVKAQAVPVGEGANRSAEIVRLDSGYDPHAQVVATFDEEFYDY